MICLFLGSEYIANTFNHYADSRGIDHFYLTSQSKAFRAERFIRTLRGYLDRVKKENKGPVTREDVETAINAYNSSYSRAVGMPPQDAMKLENKLKVKEWRQDKRLKMYAKYQKLYESIPSFKKGDYILLRKRYRGDAFIKEHDLRKEQNVSSVLYIVTGVFDSPPTKSYTIENVTSGVSIIGRFSSDRLIRAPKRYIEEILRDTKIIGGGKFIEPKNEMFEYTLHRDFVIDCLEEYYTSDEEI